MGDPKDKDFWEGYKLITELRRLINIYYEYNKRFPTDADLPIAVADFYCKNMGITNMGSITFMVSIPGRKPVHVTIDLHAKRIPKIVVYESKQYVQS